MGILGLVVNIIGVAYLINVVVTSSKEESKALGRPLSFGHSSGKINYTWILLYFVGQAFDVEFGGTGKCTRT